MSEYKEPVARLLEYGECSRSGEWPDYLKLGIGKEHFRELIESAETNRVRAEAEKNTRNAVSANRRHCSIP